MTGQVISDLKSFLTVLFTAISEFYRVVLSREEIDEIKENLIESATNLLLQGRTYQIALSFFKLETHDFCK